MLGDGYNWAVDFQERPEGLPGEPFWGVGKPAGTLGGLGGYVPGGLAVAETQIRRWVRPPTETEWHLAWGPRAGLRTPYCSVVPWLPCVGEAELILDSPVAFGPVCRVCATSGGVE